MTAPVRPLVLAAQYWRTNGHMIADVAALHFPEDPKVIDLTYGDRGVWWSRYRPARLTTVGPESDFFAVPALPVFDVVAYDPPYVSPGGRKTSTIGAFNDRYGLGRTPRNPEELSEMMARGLTHAAGFAVPSGLVLAKCKDYVTSNKIHPGAHLLLRHALEELDLRLHDRFEFVTPQAGPQPGGRTNRHARRNLSTLFVFKVKR